MKMGLYRKKPIPVRALQWDGSQAQAQAIASFLGDAVASWLGTEVAKPARGVEAHISLKTPSGIANVRPMDYIAESGTGDYWYAVERAYFETHFDEAQADETASTPSTR